jgi:hypothetical protein
VEGIISTSTVITSIVIHLLDFGMVRHLDVFPCILEHRPDPALELVALIEELDLFTHGLVRCDAMRYDVI